MKREMSKEEREYRDFMYNSDMQEIAKSVRRTRGVMTSSIACPVASGIAG